VVASVDVGVVDLAGAVAVVGAPAVIVVLVMVVIAPVAAPATLRRCTRWNL
jgi:hypothetical protein